MGSNIKVNQSDLRLLRVFSTVVESGGFTPAHIAMNVSQSTISSHMAALEARLGVRLCERGRGGFRVTEHGRQVYEAAQRLFRALDGFGSEMQELRGRLSGEIHIGAVDNVVTNPAFPLSRAIARFGRRQGEVSINLHVATPAEIERAVFEGRYHLGIGGYTKQLSGIDYIPLTRETQLLYCGREHPLYAAADEAIAMSDLQACRFVKRPYVPDRHIPQMKNLRPAAYAENMEAIAFLILSGGFIGFLPEHYAARWVAQGEIRAILPGSMIYVSKLELLARKAEPYPLAVRYFREDLLGVFRENSASAKAQAAKPTSARRS